MTTPNPQNRKSKTFLTNGGTGVPDDQAACEDWKWPKAQKGLLGAVKAFVEEVQNYPKRIKAIELFG